MPTGIEDLLDQAKKLPEAERRRLIDELVATLPEDDVDNEAFLAELERLRNEGLTQGVAWETLKRMI